MGLLHLYLTEEKNKMPAFHHLKCLTYSKKIPGIFFVGSIFQVSKTNFLMLNFAVPPNNPIRSNFTALYLVI